ncbi:MAG TPA: glycosyltransferase [Candidatus Acidoferrum sp.]
MSHEPRVALFCETYHEINGVALTVRQLVAFAKRHNRPLLAIHGGKNPGVEEEGSVRRMELQRARLSIGIDSDLEYDLFFWRYQKQIRREIVDFRPDVIHITSPGEFGQIGMVLASSLKIPLVASWHTNFHQFAARRLQKVLGFLPQGMSQPTVAWSQDRALKLLLWFYGRAAVTLAPTTTQVEWLEEKLHRPSFLMPRGVDCDLFHPNKRTVPDDVLRIGFVGRITPEKGVRLFQQIEQALESAGHREFRILFVGDGSEVAWLKQNLKHGEFLGVLRGGDLARAYANMDLFVFPSKTDTFGNVIQESAASQVASVVTNEGGPQHLVVPGVTGCIAESNQDFVGKVVELCGAREKLRSMGSAAREKVLGTSWDAAFEMTYLAYRHCLPGAPPEDSAEEESAQARAHAGT